MLMQRLTRRNPDGAANFADAEFESACAELTPANREKVRAIVDALADWEDAKGCGAIAVLPSKAGQSILADKNHVYVIECVDRETWEAALKGGT